MAFDDNEVLIRVEFGAEDGDDFMYDAAFDSLALAVVSVEILSEGHGFGKVAGEQEAQRLLGVFKPAGGVEARGELETDFVGPKRGGRLGNLFQGDESGALSGVQSLEAGGNQDAVFAGQRDKVGDGAEGDEVEEGAEIEIGRAGERRFAGAFQEGMGEFEGESDRAEFVEGWLSE